MNSDNKKSLVHKVGSKVFHSTVQLTSMVNPVLASRIRYHYYLKKPLNLGNPQTLNEKMMYLKLFYYWEQQFVADRADKYEVHRIVTEIGCPEILNDIYGAWDSVEEIEWDNLPEKFVIKCNHGSGYNIICKNKKEFDIEDAKAKLSRWMKESYGVARVEQGIYKKIKRKIIAEKFIETADGRPPKDYKFFCSWGGG